MRCRTFLFCVVGLAAGALPGFARAESAAPTTSLPDGLYAEFVMERGTVIAALRFREAPLTVTNFVGRAEGSVDARHGRPCYERLRWYRVVPGFVIQSGDPDYAPDRPDDATPDPAAFPDEFVPGLGHAGAGVLSMANAGPDTNAGEFFLTLGDCTRLNYLHSVFGEVVRGRELLASVKPDEPFTIHIRRIGAEASAFRADQPAFEQRRAAATKYAGQREPGPTAHFDDPDHLLPSEPPRARAFNFKLANFERATGWAVYARVVTQAPPDAAKTLARELRLGANGVVAIHDATADRWQFWCGADTRRRLTGPAGAESVSVPGDVAAIDPALLAHARAKTETYTAEAVRIAPADKPVGAAQRIKYRVDAVLDILLLTLVPAR